MSVDVKFDSVEKPPHVPADLVVGFDYLKPAIGDDGVYAALKRLHDDPDIQPTPRNAGHKSP